MFNRRGVPRIYIVPQDVFVGRNAAMAKRRDSMFACTVGTSEESRKFVDALHSLVNSIETETVTLTFDKFGLRLTLREKSKTIWCEAIFYRPIFSEFPDDNPTIGVPHSILKPAVWVLKEIKSREPDRHVNISYDDPFLSVGTDLDEESFKARTKGLAESKPMPEMTIPILLREANISSLKFFVRKAKSFAKDIAIRLAFSDEGLLLEAESEDTIFYTRELVSGKFVGDDKVETDISLLSFEHLDHLAKPDDCSLDLGAAENGVFYAKVDYPSIGVAELWLARRIRSK